MSAPAGSCKRSRADFEPEGAPAEADAATASTEQEEHEAELEALEAELAAVRADTEKLQRFVDYAEANLNLTADLERMKEDIGDL